MRVPPDGAILGVSEMLELDPTTEPLILHEYAMESDSPSGSLALAEQETVLVGLGVEFDSDGVDIEGERLVMVTEFESESEPPLLSETDAVQETESVGFTE